MQDACRLQGKQKHGNVIVTKAGKLLATYILHAVGMGYTNEDIPKLLYDLTTNCLKKSEDIGIEN